MSTLRSSTSGRGLAALVPRATAALLALACAAAQAGNLQVTALDKDGAPVPDAVVILQPAGGGAPRTPLPTRVTIVQEKMRFVPATSVVAVGAKARFVNNDTWDHHVRASAAGLAQFSASPGEGFELMLNGKAEGKPASIADASFDKAGAVLLGCHLHPSMRGHVYVSDSPWAALTGADGKVTMEDVPDGPVVVRIWHPDQLIDIAPQTLTLTSAAAEAKLQLNVVPRRRRI
ncbi:plastocyanin [Variovorax sp. OV329]|uniref:cupredoxin domain-containing protein n=1 Tax=Variovorax sp. OV329 TaxID=1882825 RepID=UPI0008E53E1F|nr:plastocyanin [Variovorax sp. OV329]SFM76659.1 Plastocyanin [Variovorax sp. OV329]